MTYSVVLAHGRGAQFEIPAIQSQQWAAALQFALTRVGSRFASDVHIDYASFGDVSRRDTTQPVPVFYTSRGDRVTFDGDPPAIRETRREPGAAAVGAVSKKVDQLLPDWLLEPFLRPQLPDVFQYLEDSGVRIDTNQRLIDRCRTTNACAIVGFSMGSIVGYEVLRTANYDFPVKALITAGSPIGMGPINRLLRDLAGADKTPFPQHLRLWLNLWSDSDAGTSIHGEDLAEKFPDASDRDRSIQSGQNWGKTATPTNVFGAHDPLDYLSSLAMGTALHAVLLDAELAAAQSTPSTNHPPVPGSGEPQ